VWVFLPAVVAAEEGEFVGDAHLWKATQGGDCRGSGEKLTFSTASGVYG
jgi:hypothetical protein